MRIVASWWLSKTKLNFRSPKHNSPDILKEIGFQTNTLPPPPPPPGPSLFSILELLQPPDPECPKWRYCNGEQNGLYSFRNREITTELRRAMQDRRMVWESFQGAMFWDWSLSTLFTSAREVWETQMRGQVRSSSRRLMAKATRTTTTTRKGQACISHRQDYKPENCKTTLTASAMKLLKMGKLQQHQNIQCDCAKTDETPVADETGPSLKTTTHREQKEEEKLLKLSHCCCWRWCSKTHETQIDFRNSKSCTAPDQELKNPKPKENTYTQKTTKSKDNLQSHDNNKPTTPTSLPLSTKLDFKPQKIYNGTKKKSPLQLSIISNNNNLTRDLDYLLQHNNATISSASSSSSFKYFFFFFFFRGWSSTSSSSSSSSFDHYQNNNNNNKMRQKTIVG